MQPGNHGSEKYHRKTRSLNQAKRNQNLGTQRRSSILVLAAPTNLGINLRCEKRNCRLARRLQTADRRFEKRSDGMQERALRFVGQIKIA